MANDERPGGPIATEVPPAPTDEEIVGCVLAGETALYEVLVRRNNARLYRVTRAILGSDEDAEDVMQDAWVRAFEHLDQFAGRARFSTWVTKIAAHEALARMRARRRFVDLDALTETDEDAMGKLRSAEPTPLEHALDRELAALLEAAVDSLPLLYRSVFTLRELEGMSTAETAECLELSPEAVKVRLHRARAMLRRELEARTGAARGETFAFHLSRCDRVAAAVMRRIAARKR